MGKRKRESPSCSSPHNISEGGLRREPYELRPRGPRTRSGLIRVRKAPACPCGSKSPPPHAGSPPTPSSGTPDPLGASTRTIGTIPASPIPNLEGDSSLQVRPTPEQMGNKKKESMTENDPPAPPSPNQTRYPPLDRETLGGIQYIDAFRRAIGAVMHHLAGGGTDVERVKREVGVTDELLRRYNYSTNLEEYRQNCRRIATPFIQACFAELNKTTNQADDLELLDVLFVEREAPYGVSRLHMHFRAMRKSMADPGYESPGLYCAVLYRLDKDQCHVVGCVPLENDCPGGINGGTVGKCLNTARRSAKTLGERLALSHEIDYREIRRQARELWMNTAEMKKIKEKMSHCLS